MKQAQETGKRIVSKSEYAALMGRKATFSASGSLLIATAWVICLIDLSLTLCILVMWAAQWARDPGTDNRLILVVLIVCCVLVVPLRLLHRLGYRMLYKANTMAQVIPLTRANTADLPANDSLVRASLEPVQAQETVLLRAAVGETQTPAEQLLRSAE